MACDILDSIDLKNKDTYKCFTDRYYSKRYILNVDDVPNNDIMLMFHSNRIILLCLAPSHFFFKRSDDDYTLNFVIGKVDRLSNSVKGKAKRGGQVLTPKSTICKVEWKDGTGFDIPCVMKSTLVEVNEELVKHPQLLRERSDSDGFIAIMLSSIAISEATRNELLTHEEYLKVVNSIHSS